MPPSIHGAFKDSLEKHVTTYLNELNDCAEEHVSRVPRVSYARGVSFPQLLLHSNHDNDDDGDDDETEDDDDDGDDGGALCCCVFPQRTLRC